MNGKKVDINNGCDYCLEEKDLLSGEIEIFNDICLFGQKDKDLISVEIIKKFLENEAIKIFYDDRGFLRLTVGDDIGCLDHSIDIKKINYCPECGRDLSQTHI